MLSPAEPRNGDVHDMRPPKRWRMRVGLILALGVASVGFGCASSRRAAQTPSDAVVIVPAVYDGASGASRALQSECKLQRRLPAAIVRESLGDAVEGDRQAAALGRSLKLKVLRVQGMDGGIYTGQKSLTLRGELTDKGQKVAAFEARRVVQGGVDQGSKFAGTCSLLDEVVHQLARDVTTWLQKPVDGAQIGDTDEAATKAP